jgi:AraC-like DNA-binding protein
MDMIDRTLAAVRVTAPLLSELRLGGDAALDLGGASVAPFHYVTAGCCRLRSGDEDIELVAGDLVLLPHGPDYRIEVGDGSAPEHVLHRLRQDSIPIWDPSSGLSRPIVVEVGPTPAKVVTLSGMCVFESASAKFLIEKLPNLLHFRDVDPSLGSWLSTAAASLGAEADRDEPGYVAVASRIIELLFVVALRRWLLESPQTEGSLKGLADPAVSRAIGAIHADAARHWTLEALARTAGCSRSRFAARFQDTMGESCFSYLRRWRLHLAGLQVAETGDTIAVIADRLGYGSAYSFSRAFEAATGLTPARYRRARRTAVSG